MNKERIEKIKNEIQILENGDDGLLTNKNGNLARYNALRKELSILHGKYKRSKVRCIETNVVYKSATEACKDIGCGKSAMANHLAGRFPHIRGLHFEKVLDV